MLELGKCRGHFPENGYSLKGRYIAPLTVPEVSRTGVRRSQGSRFFGGGNLFPALRWEMGREKSIPPKAFPWDRRTPVRLFTGMGGEGLLCEEGWNWERQGTFSAERFLPEGVVRRAAHRSGSEPHWGAAVPRFPLFFGGTFFCLCGRTVETWFIERGTVPLFHEFPFHERKTLDTRYSLGERLSKSSA